MDQIIDQFIIDKRQQAIPHIDQGDKHTKHGEDRGIFTANHPGAIKFIKPGGKIITTSYREADGALAISVSDSGIGIKAEDLPHVLTRFGQVDSAFTRKVSGTGLGPQLIDSLAKLHGGKIELSSEYGVGPTATVRFPKSRTLKKDS